MKIFNAVVSIIALCTYNLNFPIPNFELISADTTIPIHIQVNGGQWQTLNQQHYRFPVEVPENMLLIVSLSAYDDKSAPTSLIFAPERILDTAKELGIPVTKAPTFYVSAHVATQEIPEKHITIKRVVLTPQTSPFGNNKTKYGFPLDNNVTQEMIDHIVQGSSPDEQDIIKQVTSIQSVQQPVATHQSTPMEVHRISETVQTIYTQPDGQTKKVSAGPMLPTGTLQHKDTPQRIEATLKDITAQQQAPAQWQAIRSYLTQTKVPVDTHKDDATLYKELVEHYQACANRTKSRLNKTYLTIIEIIKNAYTAAH